MRGLDRFEIGEGTRDGKGRDEKSPVIVAAEGEDSERSVEPVKTSLTGLVRVRRASGACGEAAPERLGGDGVVLQKHVNGVTVTDSLDRQWRSDPGAMSDAIAAHRKHLEAEGKGT